MIEMTLKAIALGSCVLIVRWARPQCKRNPKTPYPSMAALDRYMMPDRNAEIALARSAATGLHLPRRKNFGSWAAWL